MNLFRTRRNMNKAALTSLLILILSGIASAQSLSGTVRDTNGAGIPDSEVKLAGHGGSFRRVARTDEQGAFHFIDVKPGSLTIQISRAGFAASFKRFNFTETAELDFVLNPENLAATVSISASYLSGTAEALERTPGSLQKIDKTELELARVFNFAEALRKIAGVNIRSEEGFGLRPNISIRGSNPTRSRKVLLLEDGVPLSYAPYGDNSSYYHPPIERFESVEVLKGSGQIEYGPMTVAGVVNYITPNPTVEPVVSVKVIGGNRDYSNGALGYSQTFGGTGVLLNFTRKQGLGSRENIRAGVNDFSAKVIHVLNDSNVLTLKYSHFDESSMITYSGLTEAEFAGNPRQNPFRNDDLEFFREGFSASHTGVLSANSSVTTNFYTSYFSRDWWRQSSNSDQRPNRLNSDPDCLSLADLNTTCGNQGTPRDF